MNASPYPWKLNDEGEGGEKRIGSTLTPHTTAYTFSFHFHNDLRSREQILVIAMISKVALHLALNRRRKLHRHDDVQNNTFILLRLEAWTTQLSKNL